jgi:hypothetical protein
MKVPGPRQDREGELEYPRVSCREAARRLAETVAAGQPGPLVVLRTDRLMTQAVSLDDPNAFIYCDGYPLPVVKPKQASPESPIVESSGPHAVLLRPQPNGRFDLLQYCLRCNRVGSETHRP